MLTWEIISSREIFRSILIPGSFNIDKILAEPANLNDQFEVVKDSKKAKGYYNCGNSLQIRGSFEQAVVLYQKAIEMKPGFVNAYYNLGNAYETQDKIEEAAVCLKRAQVILPADPLINFGLGLLLQRQGNYYSGLKYLEAARKLNPEFLAARLNFLLSLPLLYSQESEILSCRKRFEKGLDEIIETTRLETVSQRKAALAAIGSFTNFYLPYQEKNDLELQKKFGEFVCRILANCYPQWTTVLKMPARKTDEKIRIGFISAYMHSHTVAKLCFSTTLGFG